jgi:hypothetical protein
MATERLQQADFGMAPMGSNTDRRSRETLATGGRSYAGPTDSGEYHGHSAHDLDGYDDGLVHNHHWAVSGR